MMKQDRKKKSYTVRERLQHQMDRHRIRAFSNADATAIGKMAATAWSLRPRKHGIIVPFRKEENGHSVRNYPELFTPVLDRLIFHYFKKKKISSPRKRIKLWKKQPSSSALPITRA